MCSRSIVAKWFYIAGITFRRSLRLPDYSLKLCGYKRRCTCKNGISLFIWFIVDITSLFGTLANSINGHLLFSSKTLGPSAWLIELSHHHKLICWSESLLCHLKDDLEHLPLIGRSRAERKRLTKHHTHLRLPTKTYTQFSSLFLLDAIYIYINMNMTINRMH